MLGNCELCEKICNYESILRPKDENDKALKIRERNADNQDPNNCVDIDVQLGSARLANSNVTRRDDSDKFFTIGSFGSGPVYKLLQGLLGKLESESVGQFVILGKNGRGIRQEVTPNLVVIDTAHVFTLNDGEENKVNLEVHETEKGNGQVSSSDDKIDKKLNETMSFRENASLPQGKLVNNTVSCTLQYLNVVVEIFGFRYQNPEIRLKVVNVK